MITELRQKIYDLGSVIDGLAGRFYYLEAPQGCTRPYAVFSQFANPNDQDSTTDFEDVYLQINLYGESLSALEIIEKKTKEKFDDAESSFSTLTEYHVDRITRIGSPRQVKTGLVFQITLQYKFELTKL